MKHEIKSKKQLDSHHHIVSVILVPESSIDSMAIKAVADFDSTPEQKNHIDSYLNFSLNLGNYAIVDLISQKGELFELKVFL